MNTSPRFPLRAGALAILLGSTAFLTAAAHADEPDIDQVQAHCDAVVKSVEDAGFSDKVAVTCEDGKAIISSDTYPDHELMTGIVGTNEQVPVPAKEYDAPIPLKPELGDTPQTRDAALGVAVNGVPIFDYTGGGEMSQDDLAHYQAQHDTFQTQQLDVCGGHAGRGDDYHYHMKPRCMIEQMHNAGDDAILGWAFDGFPIYGDKNPDGTVIAKGVLDVCNGQADDNYGYRYQTSEEAPYIVQCLMGKVDDLKDLPRTAPLTNAATGQGSNPGNPPNGGVENLVFTQDEGGSRSMDYRYDGEDYYIRYSPSDQADCYNFESRTVTNDGKVETGEFCR
ncbi:YHYH protein [Paracoccus sp. JM45]|uniref:YHYH protein n=1 Tax=Paracoccus sp. JM45 TaxID=2283626 RepID=UPI000E6D500E|nr:YHYH protein [Paracoccus sp. JM45]RJE78950.1 YHYH protein [Paracoccus sp. JM45]